MFLERFLVLVAWQTHGLGLPWPAGTYHPTWIEWSVLAGVAAAAVLVFLLLAKVCAAGTATSSPAPRPLAGRLRLLATAACLVLGFAAAGVGLALSAGLASAPFLDPILPGSPLVFLAGLFLMVLAPVAYELIPDGKPGTGRVTAFAPAAKVRHSEVVVAAAKLVDELARTLATRPEICEAYLFGSQARGDAQPHSDVDVAVYIDPTAPMNAGFGIDCEIAADLMKALHTNHVDVVLLNRAGPLLYHRVLRDGIRVLARDLVAATRREAMALSRCCDYLPQLDKIQNAERLRVEQERTGR